MKRPFTFAVVNTVIGFLLSWGMFAVIARFDWLSVDDGFLITTLFTGLSFARTYILNKIQLSLLSKEP